MRESPYCPNCLVQCGDEGVGYLMVTQKVRTRSIEVLGLIRTWLLYDSHLPNFTGTCLLYMCIHECLCTAVRASCSNSP